MTSQKTGLHPFLELSNEEYSKSPAMLRACYDVMLRAHAGETRAARHITIPYSAHLIATVKLLHHAGVKDPVTLGAALLHDALEQGNYHWQSKEGNGFYTQLHSAEDALRQDISIAMKKHIATDHPNISPERTAYVAEEAARLITDIVSEVTNPPTADSVTMTDDNGNTKIIPRKRFVQSDKARSFSPRAKQVKMADLTSTLLMDYVYESERPADQLKAMHNRALGICALCKDEKPVLYQWAHRLAGLNADLFEEASERPANITRIDVERLLPAELKKPLPADYRWINLDQLLDQQAFDNTLSGILSVCVDTATGRVVHCRMMDDPQGRGTGGGADSNTKYLASHFTETIGTANRSIVKLGEPGIWDGEFFIRKLSFDPPIAIEKFLRCAKEIGVIHEKLAASLRDIQAAAKPNTMIGEISREAALGSAGHALGG